MNSRATSIGSDRMTDMRPSSRPPHGSGGQLPTAPPAQHRCVLMVNCVTGVERRPSPQQGAAGGAGIALVRAQGPGGPESAASA